GPGRSAPPLPASRESPLRRQAWALAWPIITPREEYCQVVGTMTNGEPFGSPFESGRRDLNATAPMRGRCFIGTYVRARTVLAAIGSYGPANSTANKPAAETSRRSCRAGPSSPGVFLT